MRAQAKDPTETQPATAAEITDEVPDIGVAEIDDGHHRLVAHYRTLLRMVKRDHDTHAFALMYHISSSGCAGTSSAWTGSWRK